MELEGLAQLQFEDTLIREYQERIKSDKSLPRLSQDDLAILIRGAPGNYFSYTGFVRWMDETLPHITSDIMNEIRSNPNGFFYSESHLISDGYIPLAQRAKRSKSADEYIASMKMMGAYAKPTKRKAQ